MKGLFQSRRDIGFTTMNLMTCHLITRYRCYVSSPKNLRNLIGISKKYTQECIYNKAIEVQLQHGTLPPQPVAQTLPYLCGSGNETTLKPCSMHFLCFSIVEY